MSNEAIILCGGLGTRFGAVGRKMPKAMIKINGRPIIDYRIEWLKKQGVNRFILACGHKWKVLKKHLKDSVIYSAENEPLGTAGAIKRAMSHVKGSSVFVTNVDDITNINLKKLRRIKPNVICLGRFRSTFGIVETKGNKVAGFKEKPLLDYWASLGFYYLSKDIKLPDKGSIEYDVFPKLKNLKAHKHKGHWITINNPKELQEAEKQVKELGL